MKIDYNLTISPEAPLTQQLTKIMGEYTTPSAFATIRKEDKHTIIQHWETGLTVAYTTEERLHK